MAVFLPYIVVKYTIILFVLKESESAEEESSLGSERGSIDRGPAPQAIAEGKENPCPSLFLFSFL